MIVSFITWSWGAQPVEQTYTSLDGGRLRLAGDGLDFDPRGANRSIVYRGVLGEFEFSAGDRNYAESILAREDIALTETYRTLQGNTIRIGHMRLTVPGAGVVIPYTVPVWFGSRSTVMTWIHDARSSEALNVFNQFTFVEADSGVIMRPRADSDFRLALDLLYVPSVMTHVEGLGHVEARQLTPRRERTLPSASSGAKVAGGRLFVEFKERRQGHVETDSGDTRSASEMTDMTLLLVGQSSVCRVYAQVPTVDESKVVQKAARLKAKWVPAGDGE